MNICENRKPVQQIGFEITKTDRQVNKEWDNYKKEWAINCQHNTEACRKDGQNQ